MSILTIKETIEVLKKLDAQIETDLQMRYQKYGRPLNVSEDFRIAAAKSEDKIGSSLLLAVKDAAIYYPTHPEYIDGLEKLISGIDNNGYQNKYCGRCNLDFQKSCRTKIDNKDVSATNKAKIFLAMIKIATHTHSMVQSYRNIIIDPYSAQKFGIIEGVREDADKIDLYNTAMDKIGMAAGFDKDLTEKIKNIVFQEYIPEFRELVKISTYTSVQGHQSYFLQNMIKNMAPLITSKKARKTPETL